MRSSWNSNQTRWQESRSVPVIQAGSVPASATVTLCGRKSWWACSTTARVPHRSRSVASSRSPCPFPVSVRDQPLSSAKAVWATHPRTSASSRCSVADAAGRGEPGGDALGLRVAQDPHGVQHQDVRRGAVRHQFLPAFPVAVPTCPRVPSTRTSSVTTPHARASSGVHAGEAVRHTSTSPGWKRAKSSSLPMIRAGPTAVPGLVAAELPAPNPGRAPRRFEAGHPTAPGSEQQTGLDLIELDPSRADDSSRSPAASTAGYVPCASSPVAINSLLSTLC
jgi:hypothetical protein